MPEIDTKRYTLSARTDSKLYAEVEEYIAAADDEMTQATLVRKSVREYMRTHPHEAKLLAPKEG